MITYRKTKQGQWVAYGPVAEVAPGDVQIHTRAGQLVSRHVETVGRPFAVDGTQMVYGYLTDAPRPPAARSTPWWDTTRERRLSARDGDPTAWE